MFLSLIQVQLKEYVKLHDTIYEVDPKEENCLRFSRLLNFKVSSGYSRFQAAVTLSLVKELLLLPPAVLRHHAEG